MVKAIIHQEQFITEVSSKKNTLTADMSISQGGTEAGMTPTELLAASLAACTCITLRMYADKKQWDLKSIETYVNIDQQDNTDATVFERGIILTGTLSTEQTKKLLEIANHCPVYKLLTKTIIINTISKNKEKTIQKPNA